MIPASKVIFCARAIASPCSACTCPHSRHTCPRFRLPQAATHRAPSLPAHHQPTKPPWIMIHETPVGTGAVGISKGVVMKPRVVAKAARNPMTIGCGHKFKVYHSLLLQAAVTHRAPGHTCQECREGSAACHHSMEILRPANTYSEGRSTVCILSGRSPPCTIHLISGPVAGRI